MKTLIKFYLPLIIFLFLSSNLYGQSYFEKGYEALREGDYETGVDFLNKAASENPENEIVHFYLGFGYSFLNQEDEALKEFSEAIKYGSNNKELLPEFYFYRGRLFYQLNKYPEAINDFNNAISYNNKNDNYYLERARVFAVIEKYADSDKDLNAALKINNDNIEARLMLALNESQRGNIDKAIDQYNRIINNNPDEAKAYYLRGRMYLQKDNYKQAVADIIKALELKDSDAFDTMIILSVLAKDELYEELEKVDRQRPGESSWKYYRAVAFEMNHEYENAIEFYKKANLLSPSAQCDLRIASCYYSMLDFENALKYADDAVNKEPENIAALAYRCEYKYDTGDIDGAISDMSLLIEIEPSESTHFNNRGWYKTSKRDYEGAKMDYTKAIALDPENANAYVSRGHILLIQGNKDAANNDLRKAIQLDNDIDNSKDAAFYALHYLGLDDEANTYMKNVLSTKQQNGPLDKGDYYTAACLYSLTNEKDKALYYLEEAINKGYTRFYHFTRDTDLDNIRDEEGFKEILMRYWPKSIERLCPYGAIDDDFSYEPPLFQNGIASDFLKWVNGNIVYPKEAEVKAIQGTVIMGFYIEKDGTLANAKVVVDVDPILDAEALRVIKSSPLWTPAKKNGEPVRHHFYFPITFSLNSK